MEILLYINIFAVIIALIIRSGMNVEGTGWLERMFNSKKEK